MCWTSARLPGTRPRQLVEAARLAEEARPAEPVKRAKPRVFKLRALELVLQALSTRPATPEELDQIRKLLEEAD